MANRATYFVVHGLPGDVEFSTTWKTRWQPRTDIYQTPDAIYIQLEAPGLDQDNVRLDYDPQSGHLSIQGHRDRLRLPESVRCLQVEIEYGPFSRVLQLPSGVDGDNIHATYEAGLLLITVPFGKPAQPVNVRVQVT